ncbi:MAG: fused MFS/spermidine synthase [Chitinispirillales bacterium]|jgi:predicted membrane-bound spermidine synthase|nr:fused MFS/spermidine synthase [Chitinispirillales bacterium]
MRKNSNRAAISPISYVYFTLFFISGISGLIYESIWSQYLKQFLGHAAYAQTLVLIIYMGGMALGAWVVAAWTSKLRNLLLGYAVVEIILGVLALVFHNVFIAYLEISFSTVIPFLGKPAPVAAYKWVTAALMILPQSMLLGATFPLMAGGILRRFPGLSGYKTSFIYFVNTFGASIGVLVSGFYLVKHWGLRGAIISGGLIDLFVGVSILVLCLKDKSLKAAAVDSVNTGDDNANTINNINNNDNSYSDDGTITFLRKREYYYPLLIISGITAAASFIYEIAWIRMLSLVLGSSTHSFELMLSAFILGLALGSFFVRNRLDNIKNAPRFLGIVQIIMGATAIITLFTYGNMFRFMVFTIDGLDRTASGYVFYNIISHLICMIMMLPTTICAGMVIPLIIHMLYKKGYGEAAIGKVYAVNTFGGIIGVAVAVWLLMELVGLKYLIIIGASVDMALGLYVLRRFPEARSNATWAIAWPASVAFLFLAFAFSTVDPLLASSGVFRYGSISAAKQRVVAHIDGRTASITLFRSNDNLVLSTNGKPDASVGMGDEFSSDEYTMALLGVLPLTIHENARDAAVIGMGAGMTSHFMLYDPMIEKLDVVEIERAMVTLAERIGPKVANTFNDPRSHIHIEDAKTFFSAQSRTYDIIVSEPSNPWVSGVSSLFSVEFFRMIRGHLNEGGILMQWFHKYEADITILVSILKALGESFPQYEMYLVGSDLLIIAAKDADTDISIKRDVFVFSAMGETLNAMGFLGISDFSLLRYGSREFFEPLINTYPTPPNSDFHSYVDLYAAKHRFMGSSVEELVDIMWFVIPVQKMVFADTGFIRLTPMGIIPDIYNLREIQNARALAQEIIASASNPGLHRELVSAPVFVLDYAELRPKRTVFTQIQSAIIQILQKTMPFLSADEMREMWDVIEEKVSNRGFSENETRWMDYFRALCNYDMPEIRRLSLELLPDDRITDVYSNHMLLASFLASSAVLGEAHRVDLVWSRYRERESAPAPVRAAKALWMEMVQSYTRE